MIAELFFTIYNTTEINCDSDVNLTTSTYSSMLDDKLAENRAILDGANRNTYQFNSLYENKNDIKDNSLQVSCEALILKHDNSEVIKDYFNTLVNNNKMGLISININPNSIDYDLHSEIKQWLNESNSIKNIINLSEKEKMGKLPSRNISIKLEDITFHLNNCKVIKDKSDKNFPFNFIIITEKITY